jgi:hypothetical protein
MTALEVSGAVCLAGGCLAGASLLRPTDRVREPFFEAGPAPSAGQG